jgi:hypothetical protein
MPLPSLEAIRKSCPPLQNLSEAEVAALTPVVEQNPLTPDEATVECLVPTDSKLDYPSVCGFGCRRNTAVSESGCPLRDGRIKVSVVPGTQ